MLRALSFHNEEIGYVQGMGYITAIFLMYNEEEEVFKIMNALFRSYDLKRMFIQDMPKLRECFYVLLCLFKKHYKKYYEHL